MRDSLADAFEAEFCEEAFDTVVVGPFIGEVLEAHCEGDLTVDGGKLPREEGHLAAALELGLHRRGASDGKLRDLVQVFVKGVEISERLQQGDRGLGADSPDTRDVVYGISRQGQEIDDLSGPDPELLLHFCC